ncbi:IS66 family insertion sequence element accessory protein TnpB [Mesorhizobium sp. M7A.F.Ca.MR.176.00.0.0]|uniref:IS66 family insertion sequence element accessory protein TnpB n=1 Tax=Mesorhizobium sp. M7A.F.Ca.MR.176.00.0.0 TaxID=2496776 RepID=UPI002479AC65|nr:IS66 family insertion sequence element accessory protein TnpB [Mesorhizobium sp. M7A.F.Ca.MR.176.00.0.0]
MAGIVPTDRAERPTTIQAQTATPARRLTPEKLPVSVQEVLKHNPLGGNLFCFRGKRGNLLKVIWHDGQGACLFTKRLELGRFIWPTVEGGAVTVSSAQLSYLLSGIDWRNPQETWRPARVG